MFTCNEVSRSEFKSVSRSFRYIKMLYSVKVNIQYYVKVYGKYKVSLNSMSKLILKLKMLIVKIISMLR